MMTDTKTGQIKLQGECDLLLISEQALYYLIKKRMQLTIQDEVVMSCSLIH